MAGSVGAAPRPATLGRRVRQRDGSSPASRWRAPASPAPEIRESFDLAVRQYPIDLVFYDNQRDDARAVANAEAAIARKVDLYIQYHRGAAANATVAQKLKAAGIPVLAVNHAVPGAPLYSVDNAAAGRMAGEALAEFADAVVGGTADGRGGHRPRVGCGRSRTGAGPGRDRGAAQAAAGRAR